MRFDVALGIANREAFNQFQQEASMSAHAYCVRLTFLPPRRRSGDQSDVGEIRMVPPYEIHAHLSGQQPEVRNLLILCFRIPWPDLLDCAAYPQRLH